MDLSTVDEGIGIFSDYYNNTTSGTTNPVIGLETGCYSDTTIKLCVVKCQICESDDNLVSIGQWDPLCSSCFRGIANMYKKTLKKPITWKCYLCCGIFEEEEVITMDKTKKGHMAMCKVCVRDNLLELIAERHMKSMTKNNL